MNFTVETKSIHGQLVQVKVYEKQVSENPRYTALPTGSTGGRVSNKRFKD